MEELLRFTRDWVDSFLIGAPCLLSILVLLRLRPPRRHRRGLFTWMCRAVVAAAFLAGGIAFILGRAEARDVFFPEPFARAIPVEILGMRLGEGYLLLAGSNAAGVLLLALLLRWIRGRRSFLLALQIVAGWVCFASMCLWPAAHMYIGVRPYEMPLANWLSLMACAFLVVGAAAEWRRSNSGAGEVQHEFGPWRCDEPDDPVEVYPISD